jgi:hypothetical protein
MSAFTRLAQRKTSTAIANRDLVINRASRRLGLFARAMYPLRMPVAVAVAAILMGEA